MLNSIMYGFFLLVFLSEDNQVLKKGEQNKTLLLGLWADYTLILDPKAVFSPRSAVALHPREASDFCPHSVMLWGTGWKWDVMGWDGNQAWGEQAPADSRVKE